MGIFINVAFVTDYDDIERLSGLFKRKIVPKAYRRVPPAYAKATAAEPGRALRGR
jgi:hypothetical protein